ncbi:hypothetical protein BN8_03376 [Fibrisoma limi BUZ 3]|uniref:Uncharacterized protein n=1 Tax=Fibrisoma limi BUZ 3 TaxID=1185876 RepID=I2GK03_9BACT|nr:hypothetical protein [Fibrisoma limi]CCH54228.1 hypothetical protein BN8_03376 [Fibrisoma limi BUZ 3]
MLLTKQTALLCAGLVLAFVVSWELYWRSQNVVLGYNDDDSRWAATRQLIYQSTPTRPVLIGSSRSKFDIDLETWEQIVGQKPIQLSLNGTSPRPVLTDLGNDPNFRGTLIVDVTEMLFFSPDRSFPEKEALRRVHHYPHWSLSEQASFWISEMLESRLVFLDEMNLSLGAFLKKLPIPNRPGAFGGPVFPREFEVVSPDRQSRMTLAFLADTTLQNEVKQVWVDVGKYVPMKPAVGAELLAILNATKRSVDQIRARGGRVIFLRTPSDGVMRQAEKALFPREKYWNRLLTHTQTTGIYFEDYPELRQFTCPEWSHLAPQDAITFTQNLIPVVRPLTR